MRAEWLVVPVCLLLASCNGFINEPGSSGPPIKGGVGGAGNPGAVALRRLNRAEYCNTVRDLLATEQRPCDDFPADDRDHGFDTIGATLSLSPVHLELYERAAASLVTELFARSDGDAVRSRILTCTPDASNERTCAREILTAFARKAWRRPPDDAEVAPYVELIDVAKQEGGTFEDGLQLALQGLLMSPHFVFRVEADPQPGVARALDDYELATRLSYFLWSSMPDDALFAAAEAGRLQDPAEIQAEAMRMLEDPKSQALVDNFAGQWLFTRSLPDHEVDGATYPGFDDSLRTAMREETQMFFAEFLRNDESITGMLTADFTFVNSRLAEHYGIDDPSSTDLVRTSVAGSNRGGLLTQGSFLTVTSNPNRTSPVKRGKWVLEQLLCSSPPPPPPNIPTLPEEGEGSGGTLRERLERHRTDPVCASCHQHMDPVGLGLENFDGIGAFRTEDQGSTIDVSGALPDGRTFDDVAALASLVSQDARYVPCVTRHLMTYGIGRGFEGDDDENWVARVSERARTEGGSLTDILLSIVTSEPFRTRRAESE